jgi:PAS domain S-box-containing protein
VAAFLLFFQYWLNNFYEQVEIQRQQNLRQLVSLARNAIQPILFQVQSGAITVAEGRRQVRESVRTMVYEDQHGKNYIFMSAYDGTMLVQPFEPEKEMTNQWDLRDAHGVYIIRELVRAARTHPAGSFVRYHYHLPGVHGTQEKLAFVVGLPELGSYIGTGMYLQQTILKQEAILHRTKYAAVGMVLVVFIPLVVAVRAVMHRNRLLNAEIETRRQTEEALRESEALFRSQFEFGNIGIAITSVDKGWLRVNPRLCEMLGYSEAELREKTWTEMTYPDDLAPDLAQFDRLLAGEIEGYEMDKRFYRKDGRTIATHLTVSCFRNQDRSVRFIIASLQDITERKREEEARLEMERRLAQTQKLESLGVFAGGIAHDLNNIMTVILGNVGLAAFYDLLPAEARERLRQAEKACAQAQTLANRLLTFAKGGAPIKKVQDLKELLDEAASLALSGSRTRFDINLAKGLWKVEVDPAQIIQVFCNLLINADQSMPQGGTVSMHAENVTVEKGDIAPLKTGKYVKIDFADQGMGIPEEYLDKIFDPYFTTKQKGSGLGLATVYSIINQHFGNISVKSVQGAGTNFSVYLPAVDEEFTAPKQDDAGPIFGHGRILVMDDEAEVREVLGKILERLGYQASFAADGYEAIKIFKETVELGQSFEAILMDLTIPGGIGGKETLAQIKKIDPQVKAIVSSGYSDDAIMADYREYGFSDAISKPYKISELSQILHKVIKEQII